MSRIFHPIPPFFDASSRVLILGSFPSVASREAGFFYGHPRNRFFRVLAALFGAPLPQSTEEKRALLRAHGIALWDVIADCEIEGSLDSAIRSPRPNDITPILDAAGILAIFVNGKTAKRYYDRYLLPLVGRPAVCLPSTSPANAAFGEDELIAAWEPVRTAVSAKDESSQ